MKSLKPLHVLPIALCTLLLACGKQEPATEIADAPAEHAEVNVEANAETTPDAASTEIAAESSAETAETAPEPTEAQRELAKKQALLDYSIMEDGYLNDPRAQWASSATASSTYSENPDYTTSEMLGQTDGDYWRNNNRNLGFDSAELHFDKAVTATEVRLVIPYGEGVKAIIKLELRDPDGAWHSVWSGINEDKKDERGPRTWFVRKFDKTAFPTDAVKVTFANNLEDTLKEIDAVQLIGD